MKKIRRLLALLALFALAAGFVYWQNFTLQVEPVELFFESLPPQFDGLRVAELSDLHGRSFGKNNVRLLRTLQKARPDMICICGDLFDEKTDLTMLEPLLTGLTDIAPVYYVTGNHEWQVKNLREILQKMRGWGVTVLENEGRVLSRGGAEMVVAGVHDPCGPYDMKTPAALVRELRSAQGNDFILMLSHRNDELAMWSQLGVQLVLSGHCHGGVVRLPFVGGVFGTRRELFPEYDAGVYRQDGTTLFRQPGAGLHQRAFSPLQPSSCPHYDPQKRKNVNKS